MDYLEILINFNTLRNWESLLANWGITKLWNALAHCLACIHLFDLDWTQSPHRNRSRSVDAIFKEAELLIRNLVASLRWKKSNSCLCYASIVVLLLISCLCSSSHQLRRWWYRQQDMSQNGLHFYFLPIAQYGLF